MTFSLYGLTAFEVQGWNGSTWVTLGSVSGNNLVKRTVSFSPYTTDRIRIVTNGSADGIWSRITEIEAWASSAPPPPAAQTNVALAANGGVASASSTYSGGYSATGVIDGQRSGSVWGTNGGWNDATYGSFPDWVQINFNGAKTIDHVTVYTVQDNFQSPVEPTDTMTFSLYGLTAFEVQGWNGSTWVTLGSVSGNNLVKRTVSFSPYTTDRIRIVTNGSADGIWSRITEIEAWASSAPPPPAAQTNVALAANGGVASASSTYSGGYSATGVIDGQRSGSVWGTNGGWNDATYGSFPDWVQINFNGAKTIDHVTVYTVQDNFQSPVEPTDTMTFSLYGLTAFEVQGWNGSTWVTLGSVSGNNLVKRTVSFSPYTTDRIRIVTNGSADGIWSRITEIEAWASSAPPPPAAQTNVALAANGGVASASSTYSGGYSATGVIDGRRSGSVWGTNGGWNDATYGSFPDWVQINFNGAKTIDHVTVYTVQDNFQSPVEPTDTMTFSLYGLTAFEVQGWNGSTWVTLGSVSGNNLVKRTVSFSPYTTDRIRIVTNGSADGIWSRITEIEAWASSAPPP